MTNSLNLTWGFSGKPAKKEDVINCVPEGWHNIVNTLIDDLFALGWDGRVEQVKEKFGALRFYIDTGCDAIHNRIAKAEGESAHTCEVCGKPGKAHSPHGWVRTLCEEHTGLG